MPTLRCDGKHPDIEEHMIEQATMRRYLYAPRQVNCTPTQLPVFGTKKGLPKAVSYGALRHFLRLGSSAKTQANSFSGPYFSTVVMVGLVFVVLVEISTAFELDTMYITFVSGAVPMVVRPFDETVYGVVNVCPPKSAPF